MQKVNKAVLAYTAWKFGDPRTTHRGMPCFRCNIKVLTVGSGTLATLVGESIPIPLNLDSQAQFIMRISEVSRSETPGDELADLWDHFDTVDVCWLRGKKREQMVIESTGDLDQLLEWVGENRGETVHLLIKCTGPRLKEIMEV